jgi:hypothetical protein
MVPARSSESRPPLVVDPDAVLAGAGAAQSFQMVARWRAQELERRRRAKLRELASRDALNGLEPFRLTGLEQSASIATPEALDHRGAYIVYR